MLARITRFPRLALGSLAVVLIAGAVLAAQTITLRAVPPGFGMVGIAAGQTARFNVVNLATTDPTTGALAPPCRAQLQFVDAAGNVLASRGVAPEGGHATFLDFTPNFVPVNTLGDVAPAARAEIRPVVNSENGLIPPPCRLSLEIFDNVTGRTQIALYAPPCRGAQCRAF